MKTLLEEIIKDNLARGVDLYATEGEGSIYLDKIIVTKAQRENGIGSRAMKGLTEYADRVGKKIVLTVSTDFGADKERLIEFYERHGFKVSVEMQRDPEPSKWEE